MDETDTGRDLAAWLTLVRAAAGAPVRLHRLIEIFRQPRAVVEAGADALLGAGLPPAVVDSIIHPDQSALERDLAWIDTAGNHFICQADSRYPAILRQIPDPPLALFVRGNPDLLGTTQVAIVGSRKPTAGGRRIAREFASALGSAGVTITSGLALGIDSAAHQGALDVNTVTVAVLGNGVDTIYPSVNRQLAERICECGALVSELPLAAKPLPQNFPKRNRIISGLSVGIVVVEAALKSGSLITARLAIEQGREVFAIPGSIHNPLSRGCHVLIRDGAKLTESVDDIFEEIGQLNSVVRKSQRMCAEKQGGNERLDECAKLLLDNIGHDPVTIDQLVEETGISVNVTAAVLLNLELQNLIESLPGGGFIRKTQGIAAF